MRLILLIAALQLVAGCQVNESVDYSERAEVANLSKRLDETEKSNFLRSACEQWTLTVADVRYFFQRAEPITSEQHQPFMTFFLAPYLGR